MARIGLEHNRHSHNPTIYCHTVSYFSLLLSHFHSESAGVYGDVQRVKILYNKKDSALIQLAEPQQAYLGKSNKRTSTGAALTRRLYLHEHEYMCIDTPSRVERNESNEKSESESEGSWGV